MFSKEHAEHYFPKLNWEAGEKALALSKFEWEKILDKCFMEDMIFLMVSGEKA